MEKFAHIVGGEYRKSNLFVTRASVDKDLTADPDTNYNFISLIRPDQQPSGPYSGISIKVNPGEKHYRLSLDIGSEGFGDDYQLVATPGIRRKFVELQSRIHQYSENNEKNISCFCALNFTDDSSKPELKKMETEYADDHLDSHPMDLFAVFVDKPTLRETSTNENEDFWKIYKFMIAIYAELRNWPSNKSQRKHVRLFETVLPDDTADAKSELSAVKQLLEDRRYVVLQGAPGTGKTFLTSKIASEYQKNVVFTQFHAETSYSDFVGGYQPIEIDGHLSYKYQEGPLIKAIRMALAAKDRPTLLIVDEINRANLSNVLGESFYLFETTGIIDRPRIQLGESDGTSHEPLYLKHLPYNLRVVATMNTADRSLAVIDFALRRRFAWYTMMPIELSDKDLEDNGSFHKEEFERIQSIFEMYATSDEMLMQPGQAYFITKAGQSFSSRVKYELLPLIREYLDNGFLSSAADQFNQFFVDEINEPIYL
ncbi:hypothetical protein FC95_GL002099 [Lentilactobacillus kefiri DSM 20587 = JCM 5818]|nr:hypothetical protein FD08_GL000973 [Lentilactobacillus parakefiri DSM 10551]KRM50118.1 hypothetical protein FC95_GL002099 [Lentilactobacillus kefiri DSM 20587 = JCM 5818]